MKKLLTALSLVGALALAGCGTTGTISIPAPTTGPIVGNSTISQIVQAAQVACRFQPTEQTVAGILATFISGFAPANGIINYVTNAICGAVSTKSLRRMTVRPSVRGVPIEGRFVN